MICLICQFLPSLELLFSDQLCADLLQIPGEQVVPSATLVVLLLLRL